MTLLFEDLPGDRVGDLNGSTATSGQVWSDTPVGSGVPWRTGGGAIEGDDPAGFGTMAVTEAGALLVSMNDPIVLSMDFRYYGATALERPGVGFMEYGPVSITLGPDESGGGGSATVFVSGTTTAAQAVTVAEAILDTEWHSVEFTHLQSPDGSGGLHVDYELRFDGSIVDSGRVSEPTIAPEVSDSFTPSLGREVLNNVGGTFSGVAVRNLRFNGEPAAAGPSCWRAV